jgi:hypothetical protein
MTKRVSKTVLRKREREGERVRGGLGIGMRK